MSGPGGRRAELGAESEAKSDTQTEGLSPYRVVRRGLCTRPKYEKMVIFTRPSKVQAVPRMTQPHNTSKQPKYNNIRNIQEHDLLSTGMQQRHATTHRASFETVVRFRQFYVK